MNHLGTKEIETKRLILRKFKVEDSENMFNNWASDDEVAKYLTWKAHENIELTKSVINTWVKEYDNAESYQWAIKYKEDNQVIGSVGVIDCSDRDKRCEIGYCISKKYWNKSIMTEALKEIIRFLLIDVGFERVQATVNESNTASEKVLEKVEMKYEGNLRHYAPDNNGTFHNYKMYSIIKKDFKM